MSIVFPPLAPADTDTGAPVKKTLMDSLRLRDDALYDWIGGGYTPVADHDHDNVNSKALSGVFVGRKSSTANFGYIKTPGIVKIDAIITGGGGGGGGNPGGGTNLGGGGGGGATVIRSVNTSDFVFNSGHVDEAQNKINFGAFNLSRSEDFVTDVQIRYETTGSPIGGLVSGNHYWVVGWVHNQSVQLSSTRGGAAINFTSKGSGTQRLVWNRVEVTVGQGGAAGTNGSGVTGGTTSFGAIATAGGGAGGAVGSSVGNAGAGGQGASNVGPWQHFGGGDGHPGVISDGIQVPGNGGATYYGGGGKRWRGGQAIGSGGGGGSAGQAAGNGGIGYANVLEYK